MPEYIFWKSTILTGFTKRKMGITEKVSMLFKNYINLVDFTPDADLTI